LVNSKKEL